MRLTYLLIVAFSLLLFTALAPVEMSSVLLAQAQEPIGAQDSNSQDTGGELDNRIGTPETAGVDPNEYEVGPGDVIAIRVWREPELTQQQTVRPDGKITLPLVGEIMANGLTPNQIQEHVTKALGEYILNPNVMVVVLQVRSKKFTITGEVGRPGSYPLLEPTKVLDALTSAGGFRDFANTKKITIIRGTERFKFNYKDVIKGKNLEQNIFLEDGDLIYVP